MAKPHLRVEEREVIAQMYAAGKSKAQIAKALGRDRTTISRELRRNGLKGLYVAWRTLQSDEPDFPDDPRRKLSHTTIYTGIDNDDHCQR